MLKRNREILVSFLGSTSIFSCLRLQSEHGILAHFGEQSLDSLVGTRSILNADHRWNCGHKGAESRVCCCYSPQQRFAMYFRNLSMVRSNKITALIIHSFPWILSFGTTSNVLVFSTQFMFMGFYQLSRLYYCFSNKQLHNRNGYPLCVFIIKFVSGNLSLICQYAGRNHYLSLRRYL